MTCFLVSVLGSKDVSNIVAMPQICLSVLPIKYKDMYFIYLSHISLLGMPAVQHLHRLLSLLNSLSLEPRPVMLIIVTGWRNLTKCILSLCPVYKYVFSAYIGYAYFLDPFTTPVINSNVTIYFNDQVTVSTKPACTSRVPCNKPTPKMPEGYEVGFRQLKASVTASAGSANIEGCRW